MDIKRELLFYHETSSHLNKRIQKSHFLFRLSILNIHIITDILDLGGDLDYWPAKINGQRMKQSILIDSSKATFDIGNIIYITSLRC
jgi:hypothetical protein